MNCSNAQQFWHDRRDGALPGKKQAAFELHLRTCAACRAYGRQMDEIDRALGALRDASHGVTCREEIAEPRGRKSATVRRFQPWLVAWRAGGIAAALALIVGTAFYLSKQPPGRLDISVSPSPSPIERSFAQVELINASAAQFIPVEQATRQPNVHVFVLYRTSAGLSDLNGS